MARRITAPTPSLSLSSEGVFSIEHVIGTQQHLVPNILPNDDGSQTDISAWSVNWTIGKVKNQPNLPPVKGDVNDPDYTYDSSFLPAPINKTSTGFTLVIPSNLGSELSKSDKPRPGYPTYYYVSIRMEDAGVGLQQQSYEVNGQIILLFSEFS